MRTGLGILLTTAAVGLLWNLRVEAQEWPLHGASTIHLASVAESKSILARRDRFVAALSPFDRQSRLETDKEITEQAFLKYVPSQALAWSAEDSSRLETVVANVRNDLAPWRLPFPDNVWLVQTTGREEGQAAYCRQHAVVLPKAKVHGSEAELRRLLIHELFHILSSHNADWRDELYRIVGFQVCQPVPYPPSLADRKVTNPDGPLLDAFIRLKVDDHDIAAVPVLLSKSERFDTAQGGPFFRYISFRLLVVQENGGKWRAAERNGEPWLLIPNEVADYRRQIGGNTDYIIHPDEILAENFVHLVQGTRSVPSPEILERMRSVLKKTDQ